MKAVVCIEPTKRMNKSSEERKSDFEGLIYEYDPDHATAMNKNYFHLGEIEDKVEEIS